MTERPPHAVLLREPARFEPKSVAGAIGGHAGLSAETWLPVVRRGWGILFEPTPAETAEALAAKLTAAGSAAIAVPASLLDAPPPPQAVLKAELSNDGLDAPGGRLSWTKLAVLSAGLVRKGGGKRPEFIELVFVDPARRLRLLAADFDYAALGDKMAISADLNFRALVAELAARAPRALRSKGARAVLAKSPSGEMTYEDFDDAGREERWLLALSTLEAAL